MWNLYSTHIYKQPTKIGKKSSDKWIAPLVGVTNINMDASLNDEGWVGIELLP